MLHNCKQLSPAANYENLIKQLSIFLATPKCYESVVQIYIDLLKKLNFKENACIQ